jgi:CheY-like chemotaxis protein
MEGAVMPVSPVSEQMVTILVVEDDPGHARLIERNLRYSNIANKIVKLNDGQEALDYLFGEGDYAGIEHASPLLVLLDLNLPVLDGFQVLKRMKSNERTRQIPVIMVTSSDDARDVSKCYKLGCNVFLTKPLLDYEQFAEAIRKLGLFLSVVTVPESKR